MLQCYLDESEKDDVLAIGGYVATEESWQRFNTEWSEALDTVNMGQPLHMAEIWRDWSADTKFTRIGHLYDIINRHTLYGVAVAVDKVAFQRLMASLEDEIHSRPYTFAAIQTVTQTILHGHEKFNGQKVDFIFDEGRQSKLLKNNWHKLLESAPDAALKYLPKEPKFADDKICLPLQAADMKAWFARLAYEHKYLGGAPVPAVRHAKHEVLGISEPYREKNLSLFLARSKGLNIEPKYMPLGMPKKGS